MTKLTETATTTLSPEEAFAHVGEFANVQHWDPGVVTSNKTANRPTEVGTVYKLNLDYRGRKLQMQYRVLSYEPGRKVVLEGSGGVVKAIDTIESTTHGDGTMVTYTADLSLTGVARLFQPFMSKRFAEVGRSAGEGLRRWLRELENATTKDLLP